MKDKIDRDIDTAIERFKESNEIMKQELKGMPHPTEETIQTMVNEVLQRYNARNVLNYDNKKGTKEC